MRLRLERRDPDAPRLPRVGENDASAAMLERATRGRGGSHRRRKRATRNIVDRPARGAVLRGDFSQGLPFRAGAFDGCGDAPRGRLCAGTESEDEAGNENDETLRRFFAWSCVTTRAPSRRCSPGGPGVTAAFEAAIRRVEHLPSELRRRRVPARKQKQKAVRGDSSAARRRRRRTRARRESLVPAAAAVSPGVAARGDVRSRVARLRDKRGRGKQNVSGHTR